MHFFLKTELKKIAFLENNLDQLTKVHKQVSGVSGYCVMAILRELGKAFVMGRPYCPAVDITFGVLN